MYLKPRLKNIIDVGNKLQWLIVIFLLQWNVNPKFIFSSFKVTTILGVLVLMLYVLLWYLNRQTMVYK